MLHADLHKTEHTQNVIFIIEGVGKKEFPNTGGRNGNWKNLVSWQHGNVYSRQRQCSMFIKLCFFLLVTQEDYISHTPLQLGVVM